VKVNAILLAGGKSSRFGKNKALTSFAGEILIARIVRQLQESFAEIIVVANERAELDFLDKVKIVQDLQPGKGPLGGLYTGLVHSDQEYNFMTGCDMPFLEANYFELLKSYLPGYDLVIPEFAGYLEPLAGIYHKNNLALIEDRLANNHLQIKSFFSSAKLKIIREEEISEIGKPAKLFFNINYQKDKKKAEKLLD